jgi:glycosyltransferase involved in cell wall biosynthesis
VSDRAPLSILFVYDAVYPHMAGGVEHRTRRLAEELATRGHRPTIAGWADDDDSGPVAVRSLGPGRALYDGSGRRSIRAALRLARQVRRLDLDGVDVVEAASIPILHLSALARLCRRAGVPLIVTWHEFWGDYWREYTGTGPFAWFTWRLSRWLERRAVRRGDHVVAVSELVAARVAAARGTPCPVVGSGVDPITPGESTSAMITVGRLIAHKRVDIAIGAAARLAPDVDGTVLTIVGDGPDRERLEMLASALDVRRRIEFTGRLPTTDAVHDRIARATVAVVPSRREGFGMFALEALASGLPVIHCRSEESAVSELVEDGVSGIAVPPDSGAVADAAIGLLGDPARYEAMSAAARSRSGHYSWATVADRFEEIAAEAAAT